MVKTQAVETVSVHPRDHFIHLSPGKLMGLRRITDENGRFKVLALDQSNSFRKALRALHQLQGVKEEPSYVEIRDVKLEMVSILGAYASAVLLDVNYSARQALNAWVLPKNLGLIVRLEASKEPGQPAEVEAGWGVEKIKRMGASAVKLLVYLDVEDKENTRSQLNFVREVSLQCRAQDILLLVEELSYPRGGEDKKAESYQARVPRNILEATRAIGPYADVLKLEFPGSLERMGKEQIQENLFKLNEVALRPWVLLSAGEKFEIFVKSVDLAMQSGASGFMAGRAIFNEYFDQTQRGERTSFLRTQGVERIKALGALVDRYATPWFSRYQITSQDMAQAISSEWYWEGAKPKEPVARGRGDY